MTRLKILLIYETTSKTFSSLYNIWLYLKNIFLSFLAEIKFSYLCILRLKMAKTQDFVKSFASKFQKVSKKKFKLWILKRYRVSEIYKLHLNFIKLFPLVQFAFIDFLNIPLFLSGLTNNCNKLWTLWKETALTLRGLEPLYTPGSMPYLIQLFFNYLD